VRFSCPHCHAVFSILDQNLPAAKDVKLSCPKCKITFALTLDRESEEGEGMSGIQPPTGGAIQDDACQENAPTVYIPEGDHSALVFAGTTSVIDKVKQILGELDFHVTVEAESRAFLDRLSQGLYQVAALEISDQEVVDEPASALMQQINLLPIHVRRSFFLCLLSDAAASLDRIQAFKMGANLIINLRDLDNLNKGKTILRQALKEHTSFYQFFREELEKKGKL
jgi:predicted Zn finger-like uncharacterized protein